MTDRAPRAALLLALLATAFLGRVVGQLVVVVAAPAWLPPMGEWYSGLLPYPWLLASQLLILLLQLRVSLDLWRGHGRFARPAPRAGVALGWFAVVYAAGMVSRYVITMTLFPERRWFGQTIPIVFHLVLAAYCWVWSRVLTGATR